MTIEAKFATLDAGLLARKGQALPAMSQLTKMYADIGLAPKTPPPSMQVPAKKLHSKSAIENDEDVLSEASSDELKPVQTDMVSSNSARVSFSMPMADYLRLKMAGQVLGKTCRSILLDAVAEHLTQAGLPDFSDCDCLNKSGAGDSAKSFGKPSNG